jgi:flagellar basal-body rod protein FlgG
MNLALWSAKTGLDAQNTQMAIISNNLANANTTGFKSDRAAFQDLMYQNVRQVGAQSTQNTQYSTGLTLGTGVRIVATEKNYAQGSVTMPDGSIAYTRDGSLTMDSQGNVVTASGYPLQPAITIPAGTQSLTVGTDGVVTAVSASNKSTQIGQIQLADFINEEGMQPTGNNLLIESAASGAPQVGTPGTNGLGTVQQGTLETSNVNTVTELVNMIECQRAYEMNSKAITTTDQMLEYLTTNLS